jgi:hypothetical protein
MSLIEKGRRCTRPTKRTSENLSIALLGALPYLTVLLIAAAKVSLGMTLVLAWNLKEYALLAADGRVRLFTDDGDTVNRDGVPKVFEVPTGIVAGSGMLHMLDALFDVFTPLTHHELLSLPGRLRAAHARGYASKPQDQWWSEHLAKTGVFHARAEGQHVEINLYHSDLNYDFAHVPHYSAGTLLPETREVFLPYEQHLTRKSRALRTFKSIDESISYHMKLAVSFMKRGEVVSPSLLDNSVQIALIDSSDSRELLEVKPLDDFDVGPLELSGI